MAGGLQTGLPSAASRLGLLCLTAVLGVPSLQPRAGLVTSREGPSAPVGTCRASCGLLPCPRLPQPSPATHTGPIGQEAHTWPPSERCHLTAPLTQGVTSIRSILCDECLSTPRSWAWAGPQPFRTSVQWAHPREAVGTLGLGASGPGARPGCRHLA